MKIQVARKDPVAASFRLANHRRTKKVAGNCREMKTTFLIERREVKRESVFLIGWINVPRFEWQDMRRNENGESAEVVFMQTAEFSTWPTNQEAPQ